MCVCACVYVCVPLCTYRSDSGRCRDCAHGARGLPEGVAEHIIRRGISNPLEKEKKKSIARGIAIEEEGRWKGVVVVVVVVDLSG